MQATLTRTITKPLRGRWQQFGTTLESRCVNELRGSGAHHTYTYAPDGLRRSAHFGGTPNAYSFVWDGDDLLNDYVSGGVSCRYDVVDGEVFGEKRGANRYLYVPDPLGSVNHLLDTTPAIAATYVYWPYGEVISHSGADTPMQFVGALGYQTWTTNRTYVRARYYRPDLGRWQTRDPVRHVGDHASPYEYVAGDPVARTDSTGLDCDGYQDVGNTHYRPCTGTRLEWCRANCGLSIPPSTMNWCCEMYITRIWRRPWCEPPPDDIVRGKHCHCNPVLIPWDLEQADDTPPRADSIRSKRRRPLAMLFALAAIVLAMAAPAQQRRPREHAKPLVSLSSHKTLSFEVVVTEKQQPKEHPPESPRRIRVVAAPPARVRLSTEAPRRTQRSDGGFFVRDFDLANLLVSDGVVQLRLYDVMRRYRSDRAAAQIAGISDPLAWLAGVDVLFDTNLSAFGDGKRIRHGKVEALEFTYEVATPNPSRLVLRVHATTRLPLRLSEWARVRTTWHEVTRRDYSRWRVDRKLPADTFTTKPTTGYTETPRESGP